MMGSVILNDQGVNERLEGIDNRAQRTHKTFMSGIGTAAKWGGAIVLAAGAAAVSLGGLATGAAVKFEKQMANVATLLDGDVKTKIGNMGDAVKKLSTDTGTSTELLTDGLYQVVSAFGETDDAMKILEISTKGASAGNATVTDSVNLLSAVTKGYGDTSAKAAQQTSDLAFLTVKLGQTTFPELASSMGKVIPLAGALTVKQEQLFGAMATLTGVTGNTAEVSTQLRGVMQGLLKPSDSMTTALKKMGFESGKSAIESLGLQGTLEGLKETVKGNDTELLNMFGSVEAGGAVLALTGAQADNFSTKTKAMGEAVGATEAAFKTQQATVSAMMEKMKASFDVVMITLGEKLLPQFNRFLTWIIAHMPQIQSFIDKAMQVAGVAFKFVGDFITNTLIPAFKAIWEWIQPYMPIIKDAIKRNFDITMAIFKGISDFVRNYLVPTFNFMKDIFNKNFPIIKNAVMQAYNYIKPSFDRLVDTVKTDLMPIIMGLWGTVKKAMPGIKAIFELVFPLIVVAVKLAIDIIADVIKVVKGMYYFIKPSLDLVADLFSTVFGGITKVIQKAKGILDWFNGTDIEDKDATVTTNYKTTGVKQSSTRGSYAVGSRYIPFDQVANIHEGEMIIPKSENPYANSGGNILPNTDTTKQPITLQLVLGNGKAVAEYLIDDINKLIGNTNLVAGRNNGL